MKILTHLLLAWLLFFLPFESFTQTRVTPQKLRVLYVGGSANWENEAFANQVEKENDVARRMQSFENMLKKYFTDVKVVNAKDYTQGMSKDFDVTVLDGTPRKLAERQIIKDDKGNIIKYMPDAYLTEDFREPVLFIGELGEKMGRSIGLKLDWYCLCLDAHAHGIVSDHAIFKGPFSVKLTQEVLPTPDDAFNYEYFLGKPTPKTLPMWRVQTKGYMTDENFRIGMVARPWGFEDSPDAEYISSGVCAKTLDAVALGRHGNFFHWGFAASPEYMTDEGQIVLANAVSYISKFKNKGVIARKYLDRRATKEYLKELKHYAKYETYEADKKRMLEFAKKMLAEKTKAEEKKAKGEKLTQREESVLNYKNQPEQSFEDFLKRSQRLFFGQFGTDSKAYLDFYEKNEPYFYSEDASYVISVDEDVKSLKIPNTDKRLLDKCIEMLEKGIEIDKAKRILDRYTLLSFETAKEWRAWYNKNKDKIFFTQSGGWYFMVNTYDQNEPANNYKNKDDQKVSYNEIEPGETSHEQAVKVASGMVDLGNGKKEIIVKVKIHPGYHIYAFVSDVDPYINTSITVDLPNGFEIVGDLQKPSFKFFNNSGTTIYNDEVIFKQEIRGEGQGLANIKISYQCCDSHVCFPPVVDSVKVKL